MKTCKILASKVFYFSCSSMCHWKRCAHVFIITHIINVLDITLLFSIFDYFRILSIVSNLEPMCVVMQIGHAFIS